MQNLFQHTTCLSWNGQTQPGSCCLDLQARQHCTFSFFHVSTLTFISALHHYCIVSQSDYTLQMSDQKDEDVVQNLIKHTACMQSLPGCCTLGLEACQHSHFSLRGRSISHLDVKTMQLGAKTCILTVVVPFCRNSVIQGQLPWQTEQLLYRQTTVLHIQMVADKPDAGNHDGQCCHCSERGTKPAEVQRE